jgi:hypothetical protein
MKKRFLFPLLAIAAPVAIGVADAAVHMAGCGLGNQGACSELARRKQHSQELATKHVRQEPVAKAAKPAKAQPKLTHQQLIGCEILLERQLKDPSSYRRINSVTEAETTGVIRYTATNSFGGRVQASHTCAA